MPTHKMHPAMRHNADAAAQDPFGRPIREYREAHGLTFAKMARQFGVTESGFFRIEKGSRRPSLPLWLRIAKTIGMADRDALLIWVRSKVLRKHELQFLKRGYRTRKLAGEESKPVMPEGARSKVHEALPRATAGNARLPLGLRAFLSDEAAWALHEPTEREMDLLRVVFIGWKNAPKEAYRDALHFIRRAAAYK